MSSGQPEADDGPGGPDAAGAAACCSSSGASASDEPKLSLWDASRANPHAGVLMELIQHGADVNARDANGWCPLHVASYYGQEDVVDVLTRVSGVDIDARNKHGETALHLAAKWPHDKAAELLCKAGADPNARNKRGRTPLHTAALFARRTVLEKLIAAGGDVNAVDEERSTPLHLAARPNAVMEMDLIMLVIRSGADIEAADQQGRLPLAQLPKPQALVHFAAAEGRLDLMQQLLGQSCAVDELNQEGLTPLQVAALRGDSALVRLLLAHGARPNVAAAKGKTSDLAPGASASAYAGIKLTTKQLVGDRTALHFAAEKGNAEVLTSLVAAGAKVNQPSVCGMTALHLAVWHQHVDAVRVLLQAKADVHARVKTNGMTPLHYVAFNAHGKRDVAKLLIEKGADIEARTQEGWTPLHLAAAVGPLEVVHELLSHGARVSAKGRKGQTALDCGKRRPEVMALLQAGSGGKRSLPLLPVVTEGGGGGSAANGASATSPDSAAGLDGQLAVLSPPPLSGMPDPLVAQLPTTQQQQQQQQRASSRQAQVAGEAQAQGAGRAGAAAVTAAASSSAGRASGAAPDLTSLSRPVSAAPSSLAPATRAGQAAGSTAKLLSLAQARSASSASSASSGAGSGAAQGAGAGQGSSKVATLAVPIAAGASLSTSPHQALSSLLKTLQSCNVSVPGAVAAATLGGDGSGPPLPHVPPGTTHLARISATGPSAPQLLAQLQEALSSAMKTHGLEACNSSLTLGEHGQCSLQPGRVFGDCKCLQASALKHQQHQLQGGGGGSGSDDAGSKAAEEKLLYMYCSNNCGFQFHASCWKVAKERLRQLYPKFTGFSASRGDSSLLPCLSGNCSGVIDEVFMGTPQSCTELYRMHPPTQPHGQAAQAGQAWPAPAAGQLPPAAQGISDRNAALQRPWQDLLVKGDQLLKELEEQEQREGGEAGEAQGAVRKQLQAAVAAVGNAAALGTAEGVASGQAGSTIQEVIARTVVSSAADMVDALSKLADVLGTGAGGAQGPGSNGSAAAAARLGSGQAGKGKVREKDREAEVNAALLPSLMALGRNPPPAYAPPPPCDPIPDDPSPVPSDADEDAPYSPARPTAAAAAPPAAVAASPSIRTAATASVAQPASSVTAALAAAAPAGAAAVATSEAGSTGTAPVTGAKKGKKKGKGGGSAAVDEDLPDWLLAEIEVANAAAAAKAKGKKAKQQQQQQQQQQALGGQALQGGKGSAAAAQATAEPVASSKAGMNTASKAAIVQLVGAHEASSSAVASVAGSTAGRGDGTARVPFAAGPDEADVQGVALLKNSAFAALADVPGGPSGKQKARPAAASPAAVEGDASRRKHGDAAAPIAVAVAPVQPAAAEESKKKKKKGAQAAAAATSAPASAHGAGQAAGKGAAPATAAAAAVASKREPGAAGVSLGPADAAAAAIAGSSGRQTSGGQEASVASAASPTAAKAKQGIAAAAAVEALKAMLPAYSTKAVTDAIVAAGGDLNAAADLLLAGGKGVAGSGDLSPSAGADVDSNPWIVAGQPPPRPTPPPPPPPVVKHAVPAAAAQGKGGAKSGTAAAAIAATTAAPSPPPPLSMPAHDAPGGARSHTPVASGAAAGRRSMPGSDAQAAALPASPAPAYSTAQATHKAGAASKSHAPVPPPPPPPPPPPTAQQPSVPPQRHQQQQQQRQQQQQQQALSRATSVGSPALLDAPLVPLGSMTSAPVMQAGLSPFISSSEPPTAPLALGGRAGLASHSSASSLHPGPQVDAGGSLTLQQPQSMHSLQRPHHRTPLGQQLVGTPSQPQHPQAHNPHLWLHDLRLDDALDARAQLSTPPPQPPAHVLLPSSLLDGPSPTTSSSGAASTTVNGQWQHAAAAWQQAPLPQAPPAPPARPSPRPSAKSASAGLGGAPALAATSAAARTGDKGIDDDGWALLQEAMQAVEADSSSLMCLPTPQAFTAEGAAAAAAAAAAAESLQLGGGAAAGPSTGALLSVGGGSAVGARLSTSGHGPLGHSGLAYGAANLPPAATLPYPSQLQQQQVQLLQQQQAAAAAAAAAAVAAVAHQQQQQQQQILHHQQQGISTMHLAAPAPALTLSSEALLSNALADMKCGAGQVSKHLLLECPDITMLSAHTPAMVEAWMREHVARFGSIASYRVLGPFGALALSLDTVQGTLNAMMGLSGRTMVMKPLSASLLADFPDDECLAGHAQQVAVRTVGTGSAYSDAMRACVRRLQELSPPQHCF